MNTAIRTILVSCLCAATCLFTSTSSLAASPSDPSYAVVDLGAYTEATAINDSGDVVGGIRVAGGSTHAFLYSNGHMHDLGTLGGSNSFATGINQSGQVVGSSEIAGAQSGPKAYSMRGFIYSNGIMKQIGLEAKTTAGDESFFPVDINSAGWMAGSIGSRLESHAAIWSNERAVAIGALVSKGVGWAVNGARADGSEFELMKSYDEGWTSMKRINDRGEAVGQAVSLSGYGHAFLYSRGKIHDLETAASKDSQANDINISGQIVGSFNTEDGGFHPFLWDHGAMRDLGNPEGYKFCSANGINALGDIVGSAYNVTGGGFAWEGHKGSAFIYHDGRWIDLSARADFEGIGLSLFDAKRINARGQIIGGATGFGAYRACMLTPVRSAP
jgi:probable HAF family extracellular repeat protein